MRKDWYESSQLHCSQVSKGLWGLAIRCTWGFVESHPLRAEFFYTCAVLWDLQSLLLESFTWDLQFCYLRALLEICIFVTWELYLRSAVLLLESFIWDLQFCYLRALFEICSFLLLESFIWDLQFMLFSCILKVFERFYHCCSAGLRHQSDAVWCIIYSKSWQTLAMQKHILEQGETFSH